jgi:hypothetical protein
MRMLGLSFVVLAALATAEIGNAAVGTVDLSWDQCSPAVVDKSTSAPGVYSAYVSVLGNDMPSTGYEIKILYSDESRTVPDAWQFNPGGCQDPARVQLLHEPPAELAKSCPPYHQGASTSEIEALEYTPPTDPSGWQTTMRIVLAVVYFSGVTASRDLRYFLGGVRFDHSASVAGEGQPGASCGGFETPMCFKLTEAIFVSDGKTIEFERGSPYLTFNGLMTCAAVPARASTWGAIKAQYRD